MEEAEILLRNAMEHHGAAVYRLALCRMQSTGGTDIIAAIVNKYRDISLG